MSAPATHARKELLRAFCLKQYCKVYELLNKGVSPKSRVANTKRTPLHFACRYGWLDVVKLLIEKHNRDPEAKDKNQETPLHHACRSISTTAPSVVKYLLESRRCDVNCKNKDGMTPIQVTPISRTDIIKELIQIDPNIVHVESNTLLHKACKMEAMETVKCLLESSCDTNCKNKFGETAIQVTPITNTSIIRMLVEKGASPNDTNRNGDSLLHIACRENCSETVKCLLEAKCNPNCKNKGRLAPIQVIDSEAEHVTDIIHELIQHGADANVKYPEDGSTILHYACRYGIFLIVKYLLKMKCDPNCKNMAGETPLHVTTVWKEGSLKYVKELIEGGADPNIPDNDGNTLLHHACKIVQVPEAMKCFNYLLEAKCDTNCRNKDELTPIQVTNPGNTYVIGKLIRNCADVNVKDDVGDTVLHRACKSGELETVKCLLEANCIPNCKNKAGQTPLQVIPLWRGMAVDIIEEIVKTGVDPNAAVDDDGNTLLHRACRVEMFATVKRLLELGFNPNKKNKAGLIPSQMTEKFDIIILMIQYGANPDDVYKTYGKVLKRPLQSPIKVFVAGNPKAGKSTLTAALKEEKSAIARTFSTPKKVTDVDQKTAGVVPHDYRSRDNGNTIIYDLAGQKEFYGSHAALMETTILSSPPIFVLVVNLCDEDNEIAKNMSYWLSFLENQCASVSSKPHIIIVGSHADELERLEKERKMGILNRDEFLTSFSDSFEFSGTVAMDCQYPDSAGMRKLRQCLKNSCKMLRVQENTYTDVSFISHCFFVYLVEKMKDSPVVKLFEMVTSNIQASGDNIMSYIPTSYCALSKICEELNDRGHIMFLKNSEVLEESWIVIDKQVLLTEVTGSIFSPENFDQHKTITQCACSTGVVPLSSIAEQFPKHNPEMLVTFLSRLEYCHEISDKEILYSITREHQSCIVNKASSEANERYFLIPALVNLDAPKRIWEPNYRFTHYFGWILQCRNDKAKQFFTSRFLQVLLLKLTFSFSIASNDEQMQASSPSLQRKCSIWKNGILWGNKHGIETIVEVTPDNRAVLLLMRCPGAHLFRLFQLRSQVIQQILKAAQKFCSQLETVESIIEPSQIKEYPLQIPKLEQQLYDLTVTDIATATLETDLETVPVVHGTISLDSLLLYEPYAGLGRSILHKLHGINDDQSCTKRVNDSILETIAQRVVKNNPKFFTKILNEDQAVAYETVHDILHLLKAWRDECSGTYRNLAERLNQFSVFAGRNPLVINNYGLTLCFIVLYTF